MFEDLANLYEQAGSWGDPILITTGALFVLGWIMLFTVRMIKRFVLYSFLALVLPNGIGFVGYIEEAENLEEAVIERGEDLSEEMEDSLEDIAAAPAYLGLLGSAVTILLGIAGMVRAKLRAFPSVKNPPES